MAGPALQAAWKELGEHPLIGEARMVGMVGALELVPDKNDLSKRFSPVGDVGTLCRDISFNNGLVMRAVRDAMIISPPLVISEEEIDNLARLVRKTLDDTLAALKADGQIG